MIKNKLKQVLEDRDKSLYWLHQQTGMSYSNLQRIRDNKTEGLHFNTLEQIMETLNIKNFDDILKREKSRPNQ